MYKEEWLALSPIDGRYRRQTEVLRKYYSEAALIRYRVEIEIEYFIFLVNRLKPLGVSLSTLDQERLRKVYSDFDERGVSQIKDFEGVTNHDVKAVEYYVKQQLEDLGLARLKEFVHFGLTSQDVNNTAIPKMMKDATREVLLPELKSLLGEIQRLADLWYDVPMLARTHGQPATPTRMGRELKVFAYRLEEMLHKFEGQEFTAKFGGATGGLNAHYISYPDIDWLVEAEHFVEHLGLKRERYTTQISNYDHLASYYDALRRIATILIDFSRDIWQYISLEYFKQKIKEGEVGSSAMPHKVNPIDFENAEGNLGLAIALSGFLSDKLPISRLQRDLSDSTVLRNIGLPPAYLLIAVSSLKKGLNKLLINRERIAQDLSANPAVIAEAIQTVLRKIGYPSPYEALKGLTRTNKQLSLEEIREFIQSLDLPTDVKAELLQIEPENYLGY